MAIWNDDLIDDEFEEYDDTITQDITDSEDDIDEQSSFEDVSDVDPIIKELLRSRGIENSSKIKFENEDGEIEEHTWDSLSDEDKLGILQSEENDNYDPEEGLDDDEIDLINQIRSSKMTPSEYINYIQKTGVDQYVRNQTAPQEQYQVDDIDDNTLYIMDILARVGDDAMSDQELEDMLTNAQANPTSFKKQIDAIRAEYKHREDENRRQVMEVRQQQQIEQYNQFAESIEHEIRNFKEFGGYDIDMDESEMEEVYDFITGFDAAGISVLGKVLNDPKTLVKIGWWLLNGEQAMKDINDYWTNEIKTISKNARKNDNKVQIVKKSNNNKKSDSFDDFDDEF